jgi:hypothetical protein
MEVLETLETLVKTPKFFLPTLGTEKRVSEESSLHLRSWILSLFHFIIYHPVFLKVLVVLTLEEELELLQQYSGMERYQQQALRFHLPALKC